MNLRKLIIVLTMIMQTADAGSVIAPRFVEQGYRVDNANMLGRAGIARVDVDGDGIPELVTEGQTGEFPFTRGVLIVLSGAQGDYRVAGWKLLPDDGGLAQIVAWAPQGKPFIVTVGFNGTVRRYLGPHMEEVHRFGVADGVVRATIGDTDGDGMDDLVILTPTQLQIYRLVDGQLLRSHAVSGQLDVALAQLDADPALEIILGGTAPGLVLDGATMASEWTYIDSFGSYLATGRLGSDGTTHWVGASPWNQFTVFRAWPWSPLWTAQVPQRIDAIAASSIDGQAQDAILVGQGGSGVHVYDSDTRQRLYFINSPGYEPSITSGDLDGDGRLEIAFTSTSTFYHDPMFTVANSADGAIEWQLYPTKGAFTALAFGDVDGDGRLELVAASGPLSEPGTVKIVDALSGREKWRSPLPESNLSDPFYVSVARVKLMARSQGQGMDIVLAGAALYDGRILVIDGVTKMPRLDIHAYAQGPLQSRWIKDLVLVDHDSDQHQDLAVLTQATLTTEFGVRIHVFSGDDGSLLWQSPVLGAGTVNASQLLLADEVNDDGAFLVAVLSTGLRAFDHRTGLLAWTLPVVADGAAYIPSGVGGAEFAVFSSEGRIGFYDATRQTLLREFSLNDSIRSIQVLEDSVHELLVATEDSLLLFDGQTGQTRAASAVMSAFPTSGVHPAIHRADAGVWNIASGTHVALYQHRLELSEGLFADGFDP